MDRLILDTPLDAGEIDAAIAASEADLVIHIEAGLAYAPDHADQLAAAIGEAALVHPFPAQLHAGGLITAAPYALSAAEPQRLLREAGFNAAPRAICAYRREAYLRQPARWASGASEAQIWSGLIEAGGAALCPRVTALQLTATEPPPEGDWTAQALFGGWLMNLLNLSGAAPPRNTDAALARYGFPGTAGDDWFDEAIALSEAQKAELRSAFHGWRVETG